MKKTLLFLGLIFSMLTVHAEDNVLQSIEIVPVKDTYNIVLIADKAVDIKKTVQADNRITLNMKGIRASRTLNTVYNNASNVDTVMVEPAGNGISIFFQAENAQAASVTFDSLGIAENTAKTQPQKVKLSNPIESYAPIYREDLKKEKTSSLFDKITKKTSVYDDGLQDNSIDTTDTMNKAFSFGLIGLLAFSVIRLFKKKDSDMKIGLSQSLTEREIEMYRNSQQPIGLSAAITEKPFTTVNYGINAYQKGNKNPYETEAMPIHNPKLRAMANPTAAATQIQTTPIQTKTQIVQKTVTRPKPYTTPVNTAPVNQSNPNVDNLKFLESMTAIYEKSGRHDLAQGLKASLTKNNVGI